MIRKMTIYLAFKKIINENISSNVDSVLGLNNDKTFNILGQERNDFWSPSNYISSYNLKSTRVGGAITVIAISMRLGYPDSIIAK